MKAKLVMTLLLSLPDFDKAFEIECDDLGISIGVVLTQEKNLSFILVRNLMVHS